MVTRFEKSEDIKNINNKLCKRFLHNLTKGGLYVKRDYKR